jgi:hypothetical protein
MQFAKNMGIQVKFLFIGSFTKLGLIIISFIYVLSFIVGFC